MSELDELLEELDRWKIAYNILFKINEEHSNRLEEIDAWSSDVIAQLEKRVKYFADQLAPQHPCHLENDDIFDDMVQDDEELFRLYMEEDRRNNYHAGVELTKKIREL